jgi:hypothetical protein
VESCHASDPGHLPDRTRAHRKSLWGLDIHRPAFVR